MSRGGKLTTGQHSGSAPRKPSRRLGRRVRLLRLALTKLSDFHKQGSGDLRRGLLLRNIYRGLKDSVVQSLARL